MAYSEGSGKAIAAILVALVAVVAIANWQSTLFVLKFVWDLIVINLQPLLDKVHPHAG